MTPIIRGLLSLAVIFVGFIIFFFQRYKGTDIHKRCYTYLQFQTTCFIMLDLSLNLGDVKISCFETTTYAFLLLNLDIRHYIDWRKYRIVIVFMLISIVSALCSHNIANSVMSLPRYFIGFVVLFISTVVLSSDNYDETDFFRLFKYPIFFALFFGFCQILISQNFSMYYSVWNKEARISSCFLDPQTAGISISILLLFVWNYLQNRRGTKYYIILTLLFIIGCFTGSKTFLIGSALAFLVSLMIGRKSLKIIMLIATLVILMAATYDYWSQLPVFGRMQDIDESYDFRKEVFWAAAFQIFDDNQVLGIGPGNFQDYVDVNHYPVGHHIDGEFVAATQPESGYLLWLDELGIMSVLWVIMIILVIKKRGGRFFNISLLIPWMIGFVSVYSFISFHVVFLTFMVAALILEKENAYPKVHTYFHLQKIKYKYRNYFLS